MRVIGDMDCNSSGYLTAVVLGWAGRAPAKYIVLGGSLGVRTGGSQQISLKRFILLQQGYKTLRILQRHSFRY